MSIQIRPARIDDATDLAHLNAAAWKVGYRGIIPDDVLDAIDAEQRVASWRDGLSKGLRQTLVAEHGDEVVGYIALRLHDDWTEVEALYVHPDAWGLGAGRSLLRAGFELATGTDLDVWVLVGNIRARRIYEAVGFAPTGEERRDSAPGFELHEMRYVRVGP